MSAPLPFVGQKKRFAREFMNLLEGYPDDAVFVDLFGGSGLLSHIVRRIKPDARVIYNDFDGFRRRLAAIPQTNELLVDLRAIVAQVPRKKRITGVARERMIARLEKAEKEWGYVDYITLSSSLLFSMKYRQNLDGLRKETLYNNVRLEPYSEARDYLDDIEVVSCDYHELVRRFEDEPGVVFLVDPPYLSTDTSAYMMGSWRLSDYLDVLTVLRGHPFVYFTSNKSSIIELCEWMGRNKGLGNPFENCVKIALDAHMNYSARYTDIMLYSPTDTMTRA